MTEHCNLLARLMPLIALDNLPAPTSSFWRTLLDGGPLYLLLHLLFVASVFTALFVIFHRSSLAWMLLASCTPYICASAAAHVSFLSHLSVLDSTTAPDALVVPFLYARHLFDWGYVVSAAFVVVAFCLRPKAMRPVSPAV